MAKSPDPRLKLIRLIHVAKRELAREFDFSDDSYRSILASVANKQSSADLTIPELERVLEHLKQCGFKVSSKRAGRPLADDAQSKKIRALWLLLHDLGAVKNPSEEALAAYVKRITKVDALQWLNGRQAETMIESLKKWAMRFLPDQVNLLIQKVSGEIQSGNINLSQQEIASLNHIVSRAMNYRTFDPTLNAYELLQEMIRGRT